MVRANAQLALFGPHEEAATYHDNTKGGFFSLLVDQGDGRGKRQSSYRLTAMPTVLGLVKPDYDTWLSQAEYIRPNRRVVNLARVGLLFADLDTYRCGWSAGRSPDELAAAVLYFCAQEGIPTPSLLIFSGQGLQAKWLLEGALPRQALPRWNACQRYLVDRLKEVGADPGAKDASRVLRLVDTISSKTGEVCRVVHVENGQDGEPIRYNFEYLCEMLLPVARWDIEKQRQERAERRQLKMLPGGKVDNLRGFSGRQLAWDRLEDLRKLSNLRGGVVEGERMTHLFWRLNFLLLSGATNSRDMYYEAGAVARELDPSWNCRSKELMTLYAKAKQYEAGEKVEFGGRKYAPLYTPKNDTLINLFEITDEEQRLLKTIISTDMALERRRERDRKRDEERRRAAGAIEREAYLAAADAKRVQAHELKDAGLSVRAIAKRMGVSVGAISGYLKQGVQSPSPITNGEALRPEIGGAGS
ncbi:helix-turn-helix domain-containing protein [Vibrio parahaemolyticus]|nr:helix-turn-helix domain-containing protein [Vibrio parahaemolyticus]